MKLLLNYIKIDEIPCFISDTVIKNGIKLLQDLEMIEAFEGLLDCYEGENGYISDELIYEFFYSYIDEFINEELGKYRDYSDKEYIEAIDRVAEIEPEALSRHTLKNYKGITGHMPAGIEE